MATQPQNGAATCRHEMTLEAFALRLSRRLVIRGGSYHTICLAHSRLSVARLHFGQARWRSDFTSNHTARFILELKPSQCFPAAHRSAIDRAKQ